MLGAAGDYVIPRAMPSLSTWNCCDETAGALWLCRSMTLKKLRYWRPSNWPVPRGCTNQWLIIMQNTAFLSIFDTSVTFVQCKTKSCPRGHYSIVQRWFSPDSLLSRYTTWTPLASQLLVCAYTLVKCKSIMSPETTAVRLWDKTWNNYSVCVYLNSSTSSSPKGLASSSGSMLR